MRYYRLKPDAGYKNLPELMGWKGMLEVRDLKAGCYDKLPERILLQVKKKTGSLFTDVIFQPFFLISRDLMKCMKLYEPNMIFREVVLLNQEAGEVEVYFLPQLSRLDCLTDRSTFNLNRSQITYMELDLSRIGDKSIFFISGFDSKYIVARLDLIESLIRRGVKGVSLEEIDCQKGDGEDE